MKKHFTGATYDLTQENMQGLTAQLGAEKLLSNILREQRNTAEDKIKELEKYNADCISLFLHEQRMFNQKIQLSNADLKIKDLTATIERLQNLTTQHSIAVNIISNKANGVIAT